MSVNLAQKRMPIEASALVAFAGRCTGKFFRNLIRSAMSRLLKGKDMSRWNHAPKHARRLTKRLRPPFSKETKMRTATVVGT